MRKVFSIIGMVTALIEIVYSFFTTSDTGEFFGFEMNIWFFRLLWVALFGIMLNGYLKEKRKA